MVAENTKEQQYRFTYNGVEYDATHYIHHHPGGREFIDNMSKERNDFTEYFRALHSDDAEKILKSFPIVGRTKQSEDAAKYYEILKKVEHLYQPDWLAEVLLNLTFCSLFLAGMLTDIPLLSVVCFAVSQVVFGWMGHSCAHSRNRNLNKLGMVPTTLLGGLSISWWSPKHNMHHMFTNSMLYDSDIQHNYYILLYPFLYLKWRFDSLVSSFMALRTTQIAVLVFHYWFLISYNRNHLCFLTGLLLGGFYAASILVGNHEREIKFEKPIELPFVEHQIVTCRNYKTDSFFWLIMMGGMQFQTEHHLFPQIPFYNLPAALPIIHQELERLKAHPIIYGPIL